MYRMFLSAVVLFGLCGCGASDQITLPTPVPVSGTITLDGEPIEGAVITFSPSGETKGVDCVGRSDSAGLYIPKQIRGEEGVPPGTYKVVINRFMRNGKPILGDEPAGGAGGIMIDSLPPKYSNPSQTKLTAKVPEDGGTIDFKLESK